MKKRGCSLPLCGKPKVMTVHFDDKNGRAFTRFYCAGHREQGEVAAARPTCVGVVYEGKRL